MTAPTNNFRLSESSYRGARKGLTTRVGLLVVCMLIGAALALSACSGGAQKPQDGAGRTQQEETGKDQKTPDTQKEPDAQKEDDSQREQSFDKQIVGTWQATYLDWKDPDRADMDEKALEDRQKESQMGFYITFKSDGTGAFYAEDLMYEVNWTVQGNSIVFPLQTEERKETVTVTRNASSGEITIDFPAYTLTMKQLSAKPDDFASVVYAPPAFKQ